MPYKNIEDQKKHDREYYQRTRELQIARQKRYYLANKDEMLRKSKVYAEKNRERVSEWHREWWKKNAIARKKRNYHRNLELSTLALP